MRSLLPLKIKLNAVTENPGCFELTPESVEFNGNCEECRPYCESLCCQIFDYIELTEAEARSERYQFTEEDPECDCIGCYLMRRANVRFTLKKNSDKSCVYLDENKMCGIYEVRPQTCRDFNCRGKQVIFGQEDEV